MALATVVRAEDTSALTVTYYHYPPDIMVNGGKPSGRYIDALEAIVSGAGYRVHWMASSIDDEANILDDGRRVICTTGRMPTAERAAKWYFLPFQFDVVAGDIVLTLPELKDRIKMHGHISKLVRNSSLTGTLLESGIYGAEVDTFISTNPGWILRTGTTDFQLMNMLLAGRAHYTIVPENQWLEAQKMLPRTNHLVAIPDFGTHPPYPIAIACSKALSTDMRTRLTDAMAQLEYPRLDIPK